MTAPEARRRGRTPIRGWDGLKRFREGRVAVPGRKPAVLEGLPGLRWPRGPSGASACGSAA